MAYGVEMTGSLFDRIDHLSPSSLRLWRNAPAAWVSRYLYGMREDGGPKTWRGKAVEAAVDRVALANADDSAAMVAALAAFEAEAKGEVTDEIEKERQVLGDFVRLGAGVFRNELPSRVLTSQVRIDHNYPGVDIPIMGYADYILEDGSALDLKTTTALPSKPRPDDVYQVAFYRDSGYLAYVTPKKAALYPIKPEEIAEAREDMIRSARSLQYALRTFETPLQMLRCYPLPADTYLISPQMRSQIVDWVEGRVG